MKKKTKLDLVRVRSVISDTRNIDKDAKIVYSERLFLEPVINHVEKIVFSRIPKEWINTSHHIVPVSPLKRRPPSTHKRVFKKGRRIKTMAALDKHLSSGGWIFWGTQKRAVHPGWVMSWQYTMVKNSLGRMWKAVRINA